MKGKADVAILKYHFGHWGWGNSKALQPEKAKNIQIIECMEYVRNGGLFTFSSFRMEEHEWESETRLLDVGESDYKVPSMFH